MTIDVEEMLRSGLEPAQIMEAFNKEISTVQAKLDAEKASAQTKTDAMTAYLAAYTAYMQACGLDVQPEYVENAKECLEQEAALLEKHQNHTLKLEDIFHAFKLN